MAVTDFLFYTLFPTLINLIDRVYTFFATPLRDLIDRAFDIELPDWAFLDITLFTFTLGSGLLIFIGITLVRWFFDLIP